MTSRCPRLDRRARRWRNRALLSATVLAGLSWEGAEAAKFPVVVQQVSDPMMNEASIPASAPTQGMWSSVAAWPLNAISLAVLPSGKLATWGSPPDNPGVQNGRYFDIWHPAQGFNPGGHTMLQGVPFVNSFCGTAAFQVDGSLLVSGGIFDSGVDKGSAVVKGTGTGVTALTAKLANDRYYSTMITLADGRKLIMGGSYPYLGGYADPQGSISNGYMTGMTPEVYDGTAWTSLFGASSRDAFGPDNSRWWYPRGWVAPNGKVFGISADTMWWLDPNGNGSVTAMPFKSPQRSATSATDAPNVGPTSTAVMYETGKILQVGGNSYDNGNGFLASSRATLVDITGANPVVTETAPTKLGRSWANSTVLPTGVVAVTGGSLWDDQAGANAVMPAELWNPKTGKWTLGAAAAIYRGYHSTAVLMQNGTVLVSGGGAPGPVNNQNTEVFYPPYLFTTTGGTAAFAPRPQIVSLSANKVDYGQALQFEMSTTNGLSQVVLLGLGLVTHSFNTNQRRYVANFSQSAETVTVQAPASGNLAPPGYYQLVGIDQNGVPSPGVIVALGARMAAPPQSSAPKVAVAARSGTSGGSGNTAGTGGTSGSGGASGGTTGTGGGTGTTLSGSFPLKASHSGLCLAVPAGNSVDGTLVTQQPCTGAAEQQWTSTAVSGGYTLVNGKSGKCLDVAYISTTNGVQVWQWSCNGQQNQVWSPRAQGGGLSLVSANSNLCLDVYQGSTQAGGGVVQWSCSGSANQTFIGPTGGQSNGGSSTAGTPTPATGTTTLKATHSGLCLTGSGGADGAAVTQQPCTDGAEQQWTSTAVGGGYTLVNGKSGKCLDVAYISTTNGAQVWQWSCNGQQNQVWSPRAQGGGLSLVSANSNLCLDVYQGSTQAGGGVVQWSCSGSANQTFIAPNTGW